MSGINTALLDVVVGVSCIYFFFSLICSALVELISATFNWRGVVLRDTVRQLIGSAPCDKVYETLLIQGLSHQSVTGKHRENRRKKQSAEEPVASATGDPGRAKTERNLLNFKECRDPAYIPSHTFVLALLQILIPPSAKEGLDPLDMEGLRRRIRASRPKDSNNSDPKSELINTVLILLNDVPITDVYSKDADGKRTDIRQRIDATSDGLSRLEQWYNNAMDRAAGSYKRKTQAWLLVVTLMVVVSGNVDAFRMSRLLWTDTLTRAAITQIQLQLKATDTKKDVANKVASQIASNVPVPLGWTSWNTWKRVPTGDRCSIVLSKLAGLSVSMVALALGAPFWFDILTRFVNLRSAGKLPSTSTSSDSNSNPFLSRQSGGNAGAVNAAGAQGTAVAGGAVVGASGTANTGGAGGANAPGADPEVAPRSQGRT